jgi:hypothetical protein
MLANLLPPHEYALYAGERMYDIEAEILWEHKMCFVTVGAADWWTLLTRMLITHEAVALHYADRTSENETEAGVAAATAAAASPQAASAQCPEAAVASSPPAASAILAACQPLAAVQQDSATAAARAEAEQADAREKLTMVKEERFNAIVLFLFGLASGGMASAHIHF